MKKLISFGIGIALLASPLIASAQTTTTSNTSIIAALEQLVATLTQELQSLIAARSSPSATTQSTSGTQTYTNSHYGFSLQYPSMVTVNPPCDASANSPESCSNTNMLVSFYEKNSQSISGSCEWQYLCP